MKILATYRPPGASARHASCKRQHSPSNLYGNQLNVNHVVHQQPSISNTSLALWQ